MQSRLHLFAWGTIFALVLAGLGTDRTVAQPPGPETRGGIPGARRKAGKPITGQGGQARSVGRTGES